MLVVEVLEQQPIQCNNDLKDRDGILCPPKSKTKGCPRKQRLKGGKKKLTKKQTRRCSICKEPGYTKPTCPNKENMDQDAFNLSQKKQKVSASDLGLNAIFSRKH